MAMEKKQLDERIQKLEEEKKKLEEEKKDLNQEKKKLEKRIQKLEKDLAKEQSQTQQNDQTINYIQSQLSQKETQLSQIQTQLSQIQTQLSQIQTQLSEKEKQLTSLQDESPAKKLKLDLKEEQVTNFPAINYGNDEYITIPWTYMQNSGLYQEDKDIILYRRNAVKKQFDFLKDKVMHDKMIGWILGPPGTGKSMSSFAFAIGTECYQSSWLVTWMHCTKSGYIQMVHFKDGCKTCTTLELKDTSAWFKTEVGKEQRIIFVDGITDTDSVFTDLLHSCNFWVACDRDNRRLVFVASMAFRYKKKVHEDLLNKVETCHVCSWTFDEYVSAVANTTLWDNVKKSLDSNLDKATNKYDLLSSKYFFAGGSCRYMFMYFHQQVLDDLHSAISDVSDVSTYLNNYSREMSKGVINRLYSSYERYDGKRRTTFCSEYVATALAEKAGPGYVSKLIEFLDPYNPSLKGWLVEIFFFASIKTGGLTLKVTGKCEKEEIWPHCPVEPFDPLAVAIPPLHDKLWLKPLKWNQGGYDAVFIDKTSSLVRIVQVTRGDSHKLKFLYFDELLSNLKKGGHNFTKVDICFIIPENKKERFRYSIFGRKNFKSNVRVLYIPSLP